MDRGHIVPVNPTPRAFPERSGFLFVGAMGAFRIEMLSCGLAARSGRRSALWSVARHPSPSLAVTRLPSSAHFPVWMCSAGPRSDVALQPLADLRGAQPACRRHPDQGADSRRPRLPVVCTSILAEELGWDDGVELLVADDPEQFARCCVRLYSDEDLWQRLRKHALDRVARECSQQAFTVALAQALA